MNLRIYLLLLFSLISLEVFSQEIDLDSFYLEKMIFYRNTNIDSSLFYSKKLSKSNDLCYKTKAISGKFYGLYRLKKYKESEKLVKQVISTIDSLDKKDICFIDLKKSALNRLFWIKKNQEKYDEAYNVLIKFEGLIVNYPLKNKKSIRDNLGLILNKATIKNKLDLPEDALKVLRNTCSKINTPITKGLKNDSYYKEWKANILNCLGNTFMKLNIKTNQSRHLDSAAYYFNKSFLVTKSFVPLHKDSEIFYSLRKTKVLIAKKNYQKALAEINNYSKISNGYRYKHREYFQKSVCYHNLKIADSAIFYAKKLINDQNEKCRRSKLITVSTILSNQYNKLNKIDSAYKYSQLTLNQYNLARADKEKTFNSLYKNDYNKAQQLNTEIKQRESNKYKKLIIYFISFLIILFVLLFVFLRKEKKQKEELLARIKDRKLNEGEKKEYNIDQILETKIINKIEEINKDLSFLKSDFSISTIADSLKTNTTYISFVFNKHNEESFSQYYTKRKIEYIIGQLKTNATYKKYSIQALAEEIGYTNASAFTRAFKKQIGVTPSVFLKSLDN